MKVVICALYLCIASYSYISVKTLNINESFDFCKTGWINTLAPWSSACFYGSLNSGGSTNEQIETEHKMLSRFTANQGVAPEILLYRLKFYQKYRRKYQKTFQDIHNMYLDYTKHQHSALEQQLEYLRYLKNYQLDQLAQETLDDFCITYVPKKRKDIVLMIQASLATNEIDIDIQNCIIKTQIEEH